MSDQGGISNLNRARMAGTAAGTRIDLTKELKPTIAQFAEAEGDKPAGKFSDKAIEALSTIRPTEIPLLRRGDREANRKEAMALIAKAKENRWAPTTNPDSVIRLTPAHSSLPVFINTDGWPVPAADMRGQPDGKAMLDGAYGLVESIRRQLRISRTSLPTLLNMDVGLKQKMVDRLSAAADMRPAGLDAEQTMELRSSSFTSLMAIATTLDKSAHARIITQIHTKLGDLAKAETDQPLGEHMARMLNHPTYLAKIADSEKTTVDGIQVSKVGIEVFESLIPQKVELKNFTDPQGFLRHEHVCGEGEGFFESFKHTMREVDIHGARFKLVPGGSPWGAYDLQLTFPTPRVVDGVEIKGIKMHVRPFRGDKFDMLGKNLGTADRPFFATGSYGGHSNIGENNEVSIAKALRDGTRASVTTPYFDDCCGGLDAFDDAKKSLGKIGMMSTYSSSYFQKGQVRDLDNPGRTIDGVTSSEGQDILVAAFTEMTRGEGGKSTTYAKLHTAFESVISSWQHPEAPNTFTNTWKNVREVLGFHSDGDRDGVMDARDIHFHVGVRTVRPDLANEYVLKPLTDGLRFDRINGSAAKDSVLDLNVASHYSSWTHDNPGVQHKLVGDGFFDGAGQKDLVRFKFDEVYPERDGRPVQGVLVQTNSFLGHTTREAHEAMTGYSFMMTLGDRAKRGLTPGVRFDGPDAEINQKLAALTWGAAFRLNYDGKPDSNDERIWSQLLRTFNLPDTLSYSTLAGILGNEHHDYSGNIKVVEDFKKTLSPETLAQLRRPEVGRYQGDPIS